MLLPARPHLQDDLLYESLTVVETLTFASLLRLPKTMPAAEKAARVEGVIATLGLQKCRDTIIGAELMTATSPHEPKLGAWLHRDGGGWHGSVDPQS